MDCTFEGMRGFSGLDFQITNRARTEIVHLFTQKKGEQSTRVHGRLKTLLSMSMTESGRI